MHFLGVYQDETPIKSILYDILWGLMGFMMMLYGFEWILM